MEEANADLVLDAPSLQMVDQMVEDWHDAAYWRKVCPFLTVDRDTQREQGEDQGAADPPADQVAALRDDLNRNGFLRLSAETLSPLLHRDDLVGRLGKGVEQLVRTHPHPVHHCTHLYTCADRAGPFCVVDLRV